MKVWLQTFLFALVAVSGAAIANCIITGVVKNSSGQAHTEVANHAVPCDS
jgi:hypothetical protein